MSLSVVASLAFVAMTALAATGGIRRITRRSWVVAGVRVLRRHRWARRACVVLMQRRLRRRHPAIAGGLLVLARATGVSS